MAFHKFIKQMIQRQPIHIYGDGKQTRDFTYVRDCVQATASIIHAKGVIGETINIGGKERASILDIISLLKHELNQEANVKFLAQAIGEPKHTWADIEKAEKLLYYKPKIDLKIGLKEEINYIKSLYESK